MASEDFTFMDPRKLHTDYGLDQRLAAQGCAYCGGPSDTVDHVPSRILLDDPLPRNLPVVPACATCNRGFSLDEEYLSCFLECVVTGTVEIDRLNRKKVQDALRHSPKLAQLIGVSAHAGSDGGLVWHPDIRRVENVVLKLARGHTFYESGLLQLEPPEALICIPLISMNAADREEFESGPELQGWPELGSRGFLRAAGIEPYAHEGNWISVQEERYRYSVDACGSVRVVLSEYLACSINWA